MANQPRKPEDTDTTLGGDSTRFISEDELRREGKDRPTSASLIILAGDEIGTEFSLERPEMTIGRGEGADVRLYSRSVSRFHAAVIRTSGQEGDAFQVKDLGSMNGTLLNDGLISEPALLNNGDKIQLGEVVFKFVLQDAYDAQFHREVHRLIHYDQLTGLMTMASFRRILDDAIHHGRAERPFCLAMTDLDGLKRVNDTYGHLAGRMVVGEMGRMMRETIRPMDRAGLYGGDEAIVLFPDSSLDAARPVAEALRAIIEGQTFEQEGNEFAVTISQGLAEWPRHGATAEGLIAAADRALYRAKADGRNCIRTAEDG